MSETSTHMVDGIEVPEGAATATAVVTAVGPDVATLRTLAGEELYLPVTEWVPNRRWQRNERVVVMCHNVQGRPTASLTSPALVALLAEGLVPEVRDGRVRVVAVARAAGVRTKLAVAASADGVDAVAACVGRGASRVRALAAALGGERVDVVAWDPDPVKFLVNSLAPARVSGVDLDGAEGDVIVAVPRHQMAAAVGEGGLNSKLAGQLSGHSVTVVAA